VLGQESQILPAFIIVLDVMTCRAAVEKWFRVLPSTDCTSCNAPDDALSVPVHETKPVRSSSWLKSRAEHEYECV
jgi:hypothetical protein